MKKAVFIMIAALTISVCANAQKRVEVKPADLPKAITENVTKDYNGYAIQKAYKVTTQNQSAYDLIVAKGSDKEKLEYSASGVFVKKSPVVAKKSNAKKTQSTTKKTQSSASKKAETTHPVNAQQKNK
ncbi:MAG TPA: hypothetical protein PKH79_13660 [Prolixibacteraceae bacterium]|nr:hypothetical protein [Prolixibacteraceae bacterium]